MKSVNLLFKYQETVNLYSYTCVYLRHNSLLIALRVSILNQIAFSSIIIVIAIGKLEQDSSQF